jgi:hypothetical protein
MGASRDAEYKLLIYKCVSIAKVFSIKWWIIKGDGYANFSHVTIVFIAKYLFTGSVEILNKIVFKIAIKFISMRNPEISLFILWKIQINSNENSKRKLIISTQSVMCSTSFVSVYWSWNTHMCHVVCNPGMNFMKVHAFLLKGWFSSLNTLCELVSNRKSSSPSSSARESVTSTCYPRFKNMKWFWQDKHDSREL